MQPDSPRDGEETTARRDRGQLVLIAAVTIAFILLGVVVVFNGVLYTQTLSSSASGQAISDADRTALEIEDGVCALAHNGSISDEDLEALEAQYPSSKSGSTASVASIEYDDPNGNEVTVTVRYVSSDLEFERVLEIDLEECPDHPEDEEEGDDGDTTLENAEASDIVSGEQTLTIEFEGELSADDEVTIDLTDAQETLQGNNPIVDYTESTLNETSGTAEFVDTAEIGFTASGGENQVIITITEIETHNKASDEDGFEAIFYYNEESLSDVFEVTE